MTQQNEIHPVGEYVGQLKQAVVGKAGTGKDFIGLIFQTDFGSAKMQLWLSDSALHITKDAMEQHFGWTGGDLASLQKLVGEKCRIKVSHEEFKGNIKARVQFASTTETYGADKANEVLSQYFGDTPNTRGQQKDTSSESTGNDNSNDDNPF